MRAIPELTWKCSALNTREGWPENRSFGEQSTQIPPLAWKLKGALSHSSQLLALKQGWRLTVMTGLDFKSLNKI